MIHPSPPTSTVIAICEGRCPECGKEADDNKCSGLVWALIDGSLHLDGSHKSLAPPKAASPEKKPAKK